MRRSKHKIKTGFNFNILLLLIPIVVIGTTFAQYIHQEKLEEEYHAKNFYFESDLLSDSIEVPEYILPEGINTISFYLKNNADSLRYSEVDINYDVILEKDGQIIKTNNGKILKNDINSERIEYTNLEKGEYIVKARAISPYEKEISAKFILKEKEEKIEYEVTDVKNSSVVEVKVATKNYSGNLTITYPEGVVPDNTNTKINTFGNNNISINFENNSSYTFLFFKTYPENVFTKENFSVTK